MSKSLYAVSEKAMVAYEENSTTGFVDPDDEALEKWKAAIDAGAPTYEESHKVTFEDVGLTAEDVRNASKK